MNARELEAIAFDLVRSRRRIREARGFAAGSLVVALATAPLALEISAAFAAGALTGVLTATLTRVSRQAKIARLALDPAAHELPEVAGFANRLATQLERQRLAEWIREIIREAAYIPDNWYLSSRVLRYADELAALGSELSDPRAQIRPASAAAVHRLLSQAVDSPLYNPALPADQLPAIIANIRLGITR
jgi:hypothetical protein